MPCRPCPPAQAAAAQKRGPLVFQLELPLDLAPTMNKYSAMKRYRWRMAAINKAVDTQIMIAKSAWPRWKMADLVIARDHQIVKGKIKVKERRTGGRRRLVVVHRFSSREPDELSCDVCGGKLPLDRLVKAELLVDDYRKWLEREARWSKALPGKGRLVLQIFELEQPAGAQGARR